MASEVLDLRGRIRISQDGQGLCEGRGAVHVPASWLPEISLNAPPARSAALGVVTYALSLHARHRVAKIQQRRGAWMVGCVYGAAGARGAELQLVLRDVRAILGLELSESVWLGEANQGYRTCAR